MAKTKVKAPEPEEEAVAKTRSRMWLHEGMAEWLSDQAGEDINTYSAADIISLAFAQRNAWRDSEEYQALLEEHGVARRGETKAKPAKAPKATKEAKPARKGRRAKAAATEEDQPFE